MAEEPLARCPTELLSDVPLALEASGPHRRIAQAIADLVKSPNPQGISIGLEGNWGAGKTTVIKTLGKILKDEPNIKLIPFDAWAHEGDPLRRTFLENIIRELQGWIDDKTWKLHLKELANQWSVTTTTDTPVLSSWGKAVGFLLLLIPLGSALFGSALREDFTFTNTGMIAWKFIIELVLGLALSFAPLLLLLHRRSKEAGIWELIFSKGLTEKRTETHKSANPTSIEFEDRFRELMAEALEKTAHRVVLVLDNLDRVGAQDALSIWSTLQTFLQHRAADQPSWHDRLWIIVLYDLQGLSALWEKEVHGGGSSKVATSFIDKSFQLRFEVPAPVLSEWHDFLKSKLTDAFKGHTASDFHQVYRVLSIKLASDNRLPTIRELKLYINQIGAIHRQWAGTTAAQDTFPLAHIAYYVLLRREGVDITSELLKSDFPPTEYKELLGEEIKFNLAAMAFNVKRDVAQQLLLTNKIKDALNRGSARDLKKIADLPQGFWQMFESIVTTEWKETEAAGIAVAARALDKSRLLKNATEPVAAAITQKMCNIAGKVPSWAAFNTQKAKGLATIIRWKLAAHEGERENRRYVRNIFGAIASGLVKDSDTDFEIKDWLKALSLVISAVESFDMMAYEVIVDSLAARLRAEKTVSDNELETLLEALSELYEQPYATAIVSPALQDLAENGHLLSQLTDLGRMTTASIAWALYVLVGFGSEIKKPAVAVAGSDGGFENVTKLLFEPVPAVVEKFTGILAHFNALRLLFKLLDNDQNAAPFAFDSLRLAISTEQAASLFSSENLVERLSALVQIFGKAENERRALDHLVQRLTKETNVSEQICSMPFDPDKAGLYVILIENETDAARKEKLLEWCKRGLKQGGPIDWPTQFNGDGWLLSLALRLAESDPNFRLGDDFAQALVGYGRRAIAHPALEARLMKDEQPEKLLDLLGGPTAALRAKVREELYEMVVGTSGYVPAEFLRVFGREISHPLILSEKKDAMQELFLPILRRKGTPGLRWILDVLKNSKTPISNYSSSEDWVSFNQAIENYIANGRNDPILLIEGLALLGEIAQILEAPPYASNASPRNTA